MVQLGVRNSISTYRLRKDLLEAYLKKVFPDHGNFNIHLSTDGQEYWIFYAPKLLTQDQKDYIDEHVRLPREINVF